MAGVHLSFEEGRGKQRISCIATAYHEFIRLGPELYIESLDVLLNAWDGEPDSMSSANLLGICRFVELYHSEYSKSRLIAKLRQVDAAAALAKLLADPSMATLIKNLAKNL